MVPALFLFASLVNDVRTLLAHHDFATADRVVRTYEAQAGATPEAAAALSFLARGELDAHNYDQADTYADETRKLTDQLLRTRKLDSDPWLPLALGASIEVHAQSLAARGERSEAVLYLRQQLKLGLPFDAREEQGVNARGLIGRGPRDRVHDKPHIFIGLQGRRLVLELGAVLLLEFRIDILNFLPRGIDGIRIDEALGRLPGWIAHWKEMVEDKDTKIGRLRQIYTGEKTRHYVPIEQR